MMESTAMTRKKVKETLNGQMAEFTSESGTLESNMESETTLQQKAKREEVNGKTEKESNG